MQFGGALLEPRVCQRLRRCDMRVRRRVPRQCAPRFLHLRSASTRQPSSCLHTRLVYLVIRKFLHLRYRYHFAYLLTVSLTFTSTGAPGVECTSDLECGGAEACVSQRCVSACIGACGTGALCDAAQHRARCHCPPGTAGDPARICYTRKSYCNILVIAIFF